MLVIHEDCSVASLSVCSPNKGFKTRGYGASEAAVRVSLESCVECATHAWAAEENVVGNRLH